MTTTNIDQLSRRIEQAIHEHIAASQRAATDAIARGFGATSGGTRRARPKAEPESGSRRRPPTEIAAIGGQLYRAVCEKPGELMAVLAVGLGSSPRELQRPKAQLKSLGQVRSVRLRHLTRYFPMAAKS